jgi:hypothetical protein
MGQDAVKEFRQEHIHLFSLVSFFVRSLQPFLRPTHALLGEAQERLNVAVAPTFRHALLTLLVEWDGRFLHARRAIAWNECISAHRIRFPPDAVGKHGKGGIIGVQIGQARAELHIDSDSLRHGKHAGSELFWHHVIQELVIRVDKNRISGE